ncbi:MAG: hypothetical protein EBX64_09395 [Betaproteobacteria bacterium]|nr:hypothetical protein [Betaproteobacteria bacterium]
MGLAEIHKRNENHRAHRAGWLRAAVLGVNDGLVSTASLMIGVVSAQKNDFVVTAGLAGIAAGAMSMAVGEYVSVKSQNDIEAAHRYIVIPVRRAVGVGQHLRSAHPCHRSDVPSKGVCSRIKPVATHL